jgi:hypothetical protein
MTSRRFSARTLRLACACLTLGLLAAARPAAADLVVGYDAVDVEAGPTYTLPAINGTGVTGSVLSPVGIHVRNGGGANYTWSGWPTGANVFGQGFDFSFTSSSTYNLSDLQIRAERTAQGPMNMELFVDTGSGFTSYGSLAVPTTAGTLTYTLGLTNVTSASFQLRGSLAGNSGTNATFAMLDSGNFDAGMTADLVVNGSIVAVPEASAFMFGGAICAVAGLWSLRQRRRREEARA